MKNECILAIDAGGTYLKSALVSGRKILPGSGVKVRVDSDTGTAEEVRAAYSELIGAEKKKAAELDLSIRACAVDTPGPFDYATGTPMMKHKYRAIYGVSLIPWIKDELGDLPLSFIHDSAAFIRGAALEVPEYSRIAGVMLGTGLGFALSIDGKPLLNANGGPLVSIYARPFLDSTAEEYVSARGIVNQFNLHSVLPARDAKEIEDLAKAGDKTALVTYSKLGEYIAEIIAPILDEYKIEALIIGGQIARAFPLFEESLKAGLSSAGSLKYVARAREIDDAHLLGAASVFS